MFLPDRMISNDAYFKKIRFSGPLWESLDGKDEEKITAGKNHII
jgi:hypothetical protein